MKIDLPNGNWANLREAEEIPRKQARTYRRVLLSLGASVIDTDVTDLSETEAAATMGKAFLAAGISLSDLEDLPEALVLAVVEEWSYGAVDPDTLDGIPDAAFRVLVDACTEGDYAKKLSPDFSYSTDEDSPT